MSILEVLAKHAGGYCFQIDETFNVFLARQGALPREIGAWYRTAKGNELALQDVPRQGALRWEPFTKDDWMGNDGAMRFSDGGEPLIAEIEVDGIPSIIVFDNMGLHVMFDDEHVSLCAYHGESWQRIPRAMAALGSSTTSIELEALHFE